MPVLGVMKLSPINLGLGMNSGRQQFLCNLAFCVTFLALGGYYTPYRVGNAKTAYMADKKSPSLWHRASCSRIGKVSGLFYTEVEPLISHHASCGAVGQAD